MAQVRQLPITTEKEFMRALQEACDKEETLYIQWKDSTPEVVLVENFIWIQTNPNDAWWYIDNGKARAWRLFPNQEERNSPWT